jgi:hypothetical protein
MNTTTTNSQIADGTWRDGAPPSVPSEAVLIDLMAYRRLTCAGCGKKGMKAVPQHSDAGSYRILASCRNCRHREAC